MIKSVLIVDDHPSIREGLRAMLIKNCIAETIIEAGSFDEAYESAVKNIPELILMDISLHGLSGIELTKKIIKKIPEMSIIIVSMYSKTQFIIESLNAGAKGYILKEALPEKLISGIKKIIAGDIYVDSHISGKVINSLINKNPGIVVNNENYESLSFREQEVLRMIADGIDVNEIADQLCISVKTVINHRTNIMTKLNCRNVIELVKYAIHIGLVDI